MLKGSLSTAAAAMSAEDEQQVTPEEALKAGLQQFLDEWFYRIIASSVGKAVGHKKAVALLLDVLGMIGMDMSDELKAQCCADADNDDVLTTILLENMPDQLKDRWEQVALQLQTVLHEASRIRTAAEDESGEAVSALFDEAGSERGGLTQQVLKSSVIYAAKEVSQFRRVHTTWRVSTDKRIDRLLGCAEEAEHSQQQLLAAEAQLSELRGDSKAKSKGVLMSMAEGQSSALVHTVFSTWLGWVEKVHAEATIRKKFTDIIERCENKLIQFKEAKIANIRGVLMRGAMEDTEVLLHMVWKFWCDDIALTKKDGDSAAAVKAVQDKLSSFEQSQRENAGKFMTRMAAGNDESLKNLCLEAWIKYHQEYAQNKEMEDQVKAQGLALKKHMDLKKDEAKTVLDRMLAGTAQGLLSLIVQNWAIWLKEEKTEKELEMALNSANDKFKSLNQRQKGGAKNLQNRVNEQINMNSMQRIYNMWIIETKTNKLENYYIGKLKKKRLQLEGVQNLFRSFAQQLEQNLGDSDDDESRRSQRRSKKKSVDGGSKGKGADEVLLPDINQKAC